MSSHSQYLIWALKITRQALLGAPIYSCLTFLEYFFASIKWSTFGFPLISSPEIPDTIELSPHIDWSPAETALWCFMRMGRPQVCCRLITFRTERVGSQLNLRNWGYSEADLIFSFQKRSHQTINSHQSERLCFGEQLAVKVFLSPSPFPKSSNRNYLCRNAKKSSPHVRANTSKRSPPVSAIVAHARRTCRVLWRRRSPVRESRFAICSVYYHSWKKIETL